MSGDVPVGPPPERKGAVKMHTLIDLHGNIPVFICITDGKVHDVNTLDQLLPEAGAFYVMDRGYLDFQRLYRLTLAAAFFVTRTKGNVLLQRRYSHPVERTTGVKSDHTVVFRRRWGEPATSSLAGKWNCSSSGSSNTCASRHFSAPVRTRCARSFGLRSPSTCWLPS